MASDPITTGFVSVGVALALYVCLILVRRARTGRNTKTRVPAPPLSGGANLAPEQAVIVKISLSNTEFGEDRERFKIQKLQDNLRAAIKKRPGTGEYDGNEFGNGVCTIYMYGPSAAQLFDVTIPVLLDFKAPSGSFVIKRYGKPGAKEERIPLGQTSNLA